jgi:neutral ceramidase
VPALFFQGTAGDQEPLDPHAPSQVTNLGNQLGNEVVAMINEPGWTQLTGPVQTAYGEVAAPLTVDLGDPAAVIQTRNKYQARLDTFPPDDAAYRHAEVMVEQLQGDGVPQAMMIPIQRWHLGGMSIMALAHEVLSEYEVSLKQVFNGDRLWVMAYANECEGYVAGNEVLQAGESQHFGYEAGWTDDNTMSGPGSWTTWYAYAAPLMASPQGAVAGTAERTIVDACASMLNS